MMMQLQLHMYVNKNQNSSFHHPYFIHNMGCWVGFFLRFSFPFNCIFKKQSMYVAVIVVIEFFSRFSISILLLKSALGLVEKHRSEIRMTFALNGRGQGVSFLFIYFFFVCSGGFEGEIQRRKRGGKVISIRYLLLHFQKQKKKLGRIFSFFLAFSP